MRMGESSREAQLAVRRISHHFWLTAGWTENRSRSPPSSIWNTMDIPKEVRKPQVEHDSTTRNLGRRGRGACFACLLRLIFVGRCGEKV